MLQHIYNLRNILPFCLCPDEWSGSFRPASYQHYVQRRIIIKPISVIKYRSVNQKITTNNRNLTNVLLSGAEYIRLELRGDGSDKKNIPVYEIRFLWCIYGVRWLDQLSPNWRKRKAR